MFTLGSLHVRPHVSPSGLASVLFPALLAQPFALLQWSTTATGTGPRPAWLSRSAGRQISRRCIDRLRGTTFRWDAVRGQGQVPGFAAAGEGLPQTPLAQIHDPDRMLAAQGDIERRAVRAQDTPLGPRPTGISAATWPLPVLTTHTLSAV
jgi:hypothetical protein